ncbi:ParB N-terminal domain-containing protein [Fusibacter sp. 3D3]|uniref:ParB N-terminal domain-containing protein n=1 Tax=Fusibacter sp. 3D3 TaxID=1048380 RepID=UPI000853B945|nr:ParB N-terminal domain-containing protein [Fusibacter sp. 3D3]GAU79897.1 plasmid partitioning protein ParB [Fusibacter sp. 3D3]
MKKDSPRRKIADAIDFLTDGKPEQQIAEIYIENIVEFSDHPFHLYEGKRLEDMIESIKNNGILNPVIVRLTTPGKYEMLAGHNRMNAGKLAGHNRMNAGKLAGLDKIPAFIKENLSDEDAYIYVIETNLMQRSFSDLYPSEKAAVLEMQYEKVASQGKRTDIMSELKALENGELSEVDESGTDSRGRLAKEYGLSGRTIARLLRINLLTEEWKLAVDNDIIALMAGVELSYIPEPLQNHLYKECKDMAIKISLKDAKSLKEMDQSGSLNENKISKFLISKEKGVIAKKDYQSIKVSKEIITKYFDESSSKNSIESIIELALKKYFADQKG